MKVNANLSIQIFSKHNRKRFLSIIFVLFIFFILSMTIFNRFLVRNNQELIQFQQQTPYEFDDGIYFNSFDTNMDELESMKNLKSGDDVIDIIAIQTYFFVDCLFESENATVNFRIFSISSQNEFFDPIQLSNEIENSEQPIISINTLDKILNSYGSILNLSLSTDSGRNVSLYGDYIKLSEETEEVINSIFLPIYSIETSNIIPIFVPPTSFYQIFNGFSQNIQGIHLIKFKDGEFNIHNYSKIQDFFENPGDHFEKSAIFYSFYLENGLKQQLDQRFSIVFLELLIPFLILNLIVVVIFFILEKKLIKEFFIQNTPELHKLAIFGENLIDKKSMFRRQFFFSFNRLIIISSILFLTSLYIIQSYYSFHALSLSTYFIYYMLLLYTFFHAILYFILKDHYHNACFEIQYNHNSIIKEDSRREPSKARRILDFGLRIVLLLSLATYILTKNQIFFIQFGSDSIILNYLIKNFLPIIVIFGLTYTFSRYLFHPINQKIQYMTLKIMQILRKRSEPVRRIIEFWKFRKIKINNTHISMIILLVAIELMSISLYQTEFFNNQTSDTSNIIFIRPNMELNEYPGREFSEYSLILLIISVIFNLFQIYFFYIDKMKELNQDTLRKLKQIGMDNQQLHTIVKDEIFINISIWNLIYFTSFFLIDCLCYNLLIIKYFTNEMFPVKYTLQIPILAILSVSLLSSFLGIGFIFKKMDTLG